MFVTVLVSIHDITQSERPRYLKLFGKLIGKNEVIYIDDNNIYYCFAKPTLIKDTYLKVSTYALLADNVKITDRKLMIDEMEKAINEITVRQLLCQYLLDSQTNWGNHPIEFEFIREGESEIRKFCKGKVHLAHQS
ncbi:hypothetical protein [Peribacillus loiseleuriae]|uniref:Uncharacterized protein n=1 Tax=Peribacillus loiseleuriae TaxID=1679170 RepID=A0A0K9GV59_9BACI|nr:hypothetical protein [Peribacillus loiseleuriae]KMY50530.1 hypothetical protein AC625_14300 [Peribacillus loiseleuriae]